MTVSFIQLALQLQGTHDPEPLDRKKLVTTVFSNLDATVRPERPHSAIVLLVFFYKYKGSSSKTIEEDGVAGIGKASSRVRSIIYLALNGIASSASLAPPGSQSLYTQAKIA